MAKRKRTYRIDIRDHRIPSGRFTCSARTTSAPEFRRREAAVRSLIEAGAIDVLERIVQSGDDRLHIATVTDAVQQGRVDELRAARSAPLTLGRTVERLNRRKEATRRKGTQHQVKITLAQLEEHFGVERAKDGSIIRDVELASIASADCEAWLHGPKGSEPWAPATQGVKHTYAKQVWSLAIEAEAELAERENRKPRLRRNPWTSVEPAPIEQTRVIFLTAEERDALLAKITDTPLHAFMALAYHGGLRLGETVHLRTGIDVDLEAGLLRVQSRPGQWEWKPKNVKRGERDVPINATLRRILQAHIDNGFAGQRFFFHAPRWDRPLGSATAYKWWISAYEAAGLKHGRADVDAVVYHTGRHSFASLLVQQGISPLIVAELIGDSYEEVIRTYGHLTPHNLREAVTLLESGPVSNESSIVSNAEIRKSA